MRSFKISDTGNETAVILKFGFLIVILQKREERPHLC